MNGNRVTQVVFTALRIVVALLFLAHGGQKLFGWFPDPQMGPLPHPLPRLIGVAGTVEFFGGLLVLLGLATRPAAFLVSGEMAVAYFRSHAPHGFWPIQNRGELAALYCFVFLFIAAYGAGPCSLDAVVGRIAGGRNRPARVRSS